MSKYDLHDIYKDLYYHELDVREKITNRLQLTFAFHATFLTVLAYMLRMVDYSSSLYLLLIFYSCLFISIVFLIKSIFKTVKAFWGNTYKALASANEIEDFSNKCKLHQQELNEFKINNPNKNVNDYDPAEKINDFLYSEFSNCASHNSKVNDKRSLRIHEVTKYLLYALIPFLLAAFMFVIFDMDAASPRKKNTNEKHNQELINTIESASKLISNTLYYTASELRKEYVMPEDDNKNTMPQDPPVPPSPPEPPKPRELIESDIPHITIKKENI